MPRRRLLFILILFAALLTTLLAACTSESSKPTSIPTTVSTSTSSYDGSWQGTGTAQDGREITVKFTVTDGAISSIIYSYPKVDNSISCTGIDHTIITEDSQSHITNNSFSQSFGPDLTADGAFKSSGSASGHISIIWQGRYTSGCFATLQAAWVATKQEAAKIITTAPGSVAW